MIPGTSASCFRENRTIPAKRGCLALGFSQVHGGVIPAMLRNVMVKFCAIVCSALAILSGASEATAVTYYVSKTGVDSNPGTENQPFLTVQAALDVAQPGDRVLLAAGVYPEVVKTVRNGSPAAPIVLDGQGVGTVQRIIVSFACQRFQNLTISGATNAYASLIWLRRNGHSTIVSNCVLNAQYARNVGGLTWETPSTTPFGSDAASNCLVISNRITGILGTTAISIAGDNNQFKANYVHDLGQADFLRLWGRDNIISGNTFTNIYTVDGIGNHIDFVQTFGNNGFGSWGHIIENNRVISIQGGQLSQLEGNVVPEIGNWTFRNNIFAHIDLQASCSIPEIKYYNNLFYMCNTVNGSHPLLFGSRAYTDPARDRTIGTNYAHSAQVINNVFLDCGDGRTTRGWYSAGTELTNCVADYNFVAKNGFGRVSSGTGALGEVGYDSMKFFEHHGINGGDPRFFNVAGLDFRLMTRSFLINSGTSVPGLSEDVIGTARPQGREVDIGPFEYVPTTTEAPGAPVRLRAFGN